MPGVYRLLGGPGSPYSHKLRAVLRYRRIPHVWIMPQGGFGGSGALGDGTELEKAGKGMIPVLQYPDGGYRADSTPILYDLETRHAERSIVPPDPGHAFLAHLIEDMADEWLPLPMFYFRWTDDQRWCAERQMVGWIGAVGEDALASQAQAFMDRQKAQLEAAGLAAWPRDTVLAQYDAVLDILERQLCESLFLFGSRPSLAEFGLYGQLTQYAVDPFVCNRMKERAVRVYQWVHLMDDASGIEGEWLAPDAELSAPVRDLLGLAGSLHLPILQRMLELGGGPR
ncbi:MAG: glutathione S-transferase, partial [Deltaproteobacteria bacterium]|nr:glutathione S-transferase [Deltaproteobacteria bacterium]